MDTPATLYLDRVGLGHRVVRFPRPQSAAESAAAQGIPIGSLIKTLVVRRGEDDYLFVLVPGDRALDWPKLRAVLGVSRLSLPDAGEARTVTGYERGTITPFGAARRLPVVADASLAGLDPVGIGGGAHGVAIHLAAPELLEHLGAVVADVTRPG